LWRSGASAPEDLGAFIAEAITGDGRVVVGSSSSVQDLHPIIWDATSGVRNLSETLIDAGADLQGLTLIAAKDISRDGRFVVGDGSRSGRREPWLVRLPTP
jgi:hypothetical protein